MKINSREFLSAGIFVLLIGCDESTNTTNLPEQSVRNAINAELQSLPELIIRRTQREEKWARTREYGGNFELKNLSRSVSRSIDVSNNDDSFSTTITGTAVEFSLVALEESKVTCEGGSVFSTEVEYIGYALCDASDYDYKTIQPGRN